MNDQYDFRIHRYDVAADTSSTVLSGEYGELFSLDPLGGHIYGVARLLNQVK